MPIRSTRRFWLQTMVFGCGHALALLSALALSLASLSAIAFAQTTAANDPQASEAVRAVVAEHGHWNQYRGPRGNGSTDADLPLEFSEGSPQVLWKTPITGRAWSSPVVWEDRIWLTNAPEIQNAPGLSDFDAIPKTLPPALDPPLKFSVVCLDAKSGQVLKDFPVLDVTHPQFTHLTNSYASSTPVVEAGRLYAHYGSHGTVCVDTKTDQVLWRRTDIYCHHWRGAGSSPIVHGDLLYVAFDGYDHQFMIALNKHTGETVWVRNRDVDFDTDDGDAKKAYSTATVVEVDGRLLVVSPFASATTAYDALSGETVWTVHHSGMNAAARPVVGNGLVYVSAGDGRDTVVAIDPRMELPDGQERIRWQLGRSTPKRPSPMLIGDALFMLEDKGVLSWLDAKTGEAITNDRATGNYWASPLLARDRIYVFSQEGRVTVLQADESLKVLAINQLDEGMNASPAVVGNCLILRTFKHVYCIGN